MIDEIEGNEGFNAYLYKDFGKAGMSLIEPMKFSPNSLKNISPKLAIDSARAVVTKFSDPKTDDQRDPSIKILSAKKAAKINDIKITDKWNYNLTSDFSIAVSTVGFIIGFGSTFFHALSLASSVSVGSMLPTLLGTASVAGLMLYEGVHAIKTKRSLIADLTNYIKLRHLLNNNKSIDDNGRPAIKLVDIDPRYISSPMLAKLSDQYGMERDQAKSYARIILHRGKSHLKYFDAYQRIFSFSKEEVSDMLSGKITFYLEDETKELKEQYKHIVETRYFGKDSKFNKQPALLTDETQVEQPQILPPHITPAQVARVRENLAQLDIASQVNEALTTNSVSAAHKVGEAEINEISRILSTINTDSQSTLSIAKGLIERLSPVSETIARSQKDIQLLRDNSLWGMARRAFNRLTIHRFAANVTANFNEIDRDVAGAHATSISLMERFETLGSLGKLLDAPLMKINDTIETALGETPASTEVETVLRATQKHALTLHALSQQAQQMVGMLVAGESNFATFTRGIGIANVATGLAQTVSDMAEKNRMVTGLTAPVNDQIASSMQLFEERLLQVQAQIAKHAAEFEKGAALARDFRNNVLLSLPAPEQDLGNPLDQLTTRTLEPIAVPRVA